MTLPENFSRLAEKFINNSYPTVTIAIPTYNEVEYIENLIHGFQSTTYPNLLEIIIVDSSVDGTQDIVKKLSIEDDRVILIENPCKIQSAGLNIAAQVATGDVFLRADAHTEYANNYVNECVSALLESESVNVGGAQRFIAKNQFQAGVAIAARSALGSGKAKYRDPNYHGYAETVYLGCFWRDMFTQISGYNPHLAVNEDGDLNIRLSEYAAKNFNIEPHKAIFISSKIKCWYYPRKTIKSLVIQYFKYGRARRDTSMNYSSLSAVNIRGQIPFFVISMFLSISIISIFFPQMKLLSMICLFSFLGAVILNGCLATWQTLNIFKSEIWRGTDDNIPSFMNRFYYCVVAIFAMILAQASGYGYQIISHTVRSRDRE